MNQSERSMHFIKAALELARSFGMSTVAEGIEDAEIGASLSALGCSLAQGYHYGKPMPQDQVVAWAAKHRSAQAAASRTSPAPQLLG